MKKIILIVTVAITFLLVVFGYNIFRTLEISTSTQRAKWQDHWQGGYHILDGGFDVDLYPGEESEIFNKAQYICCHEGGDITLKFIEGDETISYTAGESFKLAYVDVTIVSGSFTVN